MISPRERDREREQENFFKTYVIRNGFFFVLFEISLMETYGRCNFLWFPLKPFIENIYKNVELVINRVEKKKTRNAKALKTNCY